MCQQCCHGSWGCQPDHVPDHHVLVQQNLRADKGQGRALQMDNPVNIYYTYVSTPEQADDLWAQQVSLSGVSLVYA